MRSFQRGRVQAFGACSATARALRQVAAHHQRIQMFAPRLPVIAFTAADNGKSRPVIQPSRRLIVLLDLEEHGAYAAPGEMSEVGEQQLSRQALAAIAGS